MLYLLKELSPNIKKLKTSQRIWLYENIVYTIYNWSEICVSENLTFCPTTLFSNANDCNLETDNYCDLNNIYGSLWNLKLLTFKNGNYLKSENDNFKSAIDLASKIEKPDFNENYREYKISNLRELLYLEIMFLIQSDNFVSICKNCGKYFVLNDFKCKYCSRTDENGMTCLKANQKKKRDKKLENQTNRLYKQYYEKLHKRVINGIMKEAEFNMWKNEAKKKLNEVLNNHLDYNEFKDWCKTFDPVKKTYFPEKNA